MSEFAYDQGYSNGEPRLGLVNPTTTLLLREGVGRLEQHLCLEAGSEYCVLTPNVQLGLFVALRAAGVHSGDRVLCSGFAPETVLQTILLAGAEPLLVDIHPSTFNIDPYCMEYVIGKCIRTQQTLPKAVIATDMFGLPCNYEALEPICAKHGIQMVEDMGVGFGAALGRRSCGSFGRFAVASLSLDSEEAQTGEGGVIFCHSQKDQIRLTQLLEECGSDRGTSAASKETVRSRLAQLRIRELDVQVASRQKVANRYQELLGERVKLQQIPEGFSSAYNRFVVALPPAVNKLRMLNQLHEQGVPCSGFRPSFYELQQENDWNRVKLPHAQNAYSKLISIPMHAYLSTRVAEYVAGQLLAELDKVQQCSLAELS